MTNGEKIKEIFPNLKYKEGGNCVTLNFDKYIGTVIPHDFWYAEYKEPTTTIDYRRAFKIACDLLNGDILYGVDTDEIYELMMKKDEVVSSSSYEEYILNHLQDLDQGQYASEPTTKNDLGVDAVSRKAVINQIFYSTDNNGDVVLGSALRERIARLPSVTPQLSSGLEKDSKKLDCISREQAIEEADKLCLETGYDNEKVIEMLNELPTVTLQPSWIPISEKLPEDDGLYLVIEKSGRVCNYVFHKGNSEEYWKRCAVAWMER